MHSCAGARVDTLQKVGAMAEEGRGVSHEQAACPVLTCPESHRHRFEFRMRAWDDA